MNGARAFAASPGGDLWICSRDGRAYVSHDWNQSWSEVEIQAEKPGELGLGGDELEHLRFFDDQRAILAGYIGNKDKDSILRTVDGGRTWSYVRLPIAEWVYDAQVDASGHAWLVGSTGDLLASEDFGATWTVAGQPFDGLYRSASVYFWSRENGVVGALSNGLKITSDGGRTWTPLPTPADELFPPTADPSKAGDRVMVKGKDGKREWRELPVGFDEPVKHVWVVGDHLLASQHGQVFHHPLAARNGWAPFEIDGHKIITVEFNGHDLIVVGDDRSVSIVSPQLQRTTRCEQPLEKEPLAVTSGPRGAAFLVDARGKVCLVANEKLSCSRLMSVGLDRKWEIASYDRADDGTLFGASSTALYRSTNSGKSWEHLAEADRFDGVEARADASGFIVVDGGKLLEWKNDSKSVSPIEISGAADTQLDVVARKGRLWVATGFEAAKDPEVQRMLRTSDTVLVGPGFTATVFVSQDEGRHWKQVDRSTGAVVSAAWLGQDDVLRLCMSDHSIRCGSVAADAGGAASCGFQATTGTEPLGGQWATWLAFPEPKVGWVGGNYFFKGPVLHRTADGGNHWSIVEHAEDHVTEAYRLGSGACIRIVGFWHPHTRVEMWRNGKFDLIREFDPGVHDARVDSGGRLLVRQQDGKVWSLDDNGIAWSEVGKIDVPPR
ncbi:MAG TPA: YCF48-related protein [Planctomycetota bacterium]|nr:YCF48-related protein [Planctomycetota bacterium]